MKQYVDIRKLILKGSSFPNKFAQLKQPLRHSKVNVREKKNLKHSRVSAREKKLGHNRVSEKQDNNTSDGREKKFYGTAGHPK